MGRHKKLFNKIKEDEDEAGESVKSETSSILNPVEAQKILDEKKEEKEDESKYKKKKREREKEEAEKVERVQQGFGLLLSGVADFICKRMPNPIPATDAEKLFFSTYGTEVILEYFPVVATHHKLTAFGAVCAEMVGSRLKKPKIKESIITDETNDKADNRADGNG